MKSRRLSCTLLITVWMAALSSFASADQLAGGPSNPPTRFSDVVQVSGAVQPSNSIEAAATEATISKYFIALNHGDVAAALQFYADNPVLLPFLQPTTVGIEAVRQNYKDTFKHVRFQMHTTIQELVVMSPDWAYVRSDSAGLFTPTKSGKSTTATFHELFLLRKSGDGIWRIARYSFSPTAELPPV